MSTDTKSPIRGQFCRYHADVVKDSIWETDSACRYTWASSSDFQIRGFDHSEFLGKSFFDFFPSESRDAVTRAFAEVLRRTVAGNPLPLVLDQIPQNIQGGGSIATEITIRAVIEDGRHIGFVGCTRDQSRQAEEGEKIRDYIGEISSLRSELTTMATTDRLTGLANRVRFEEMTLEESRRSSRYSLTFSVALIDIDRLQNVNERFGRLSGDEVLRSMADLIRRSIRNIDHAFRWDGGEFALLLPNTALSPAAMVLERIRSAVENFSFPAAGRLTVSIGLAEAAKDEALDSITARADRALHAAKAGGRNQLTLAS